MQMALRLYVGSVVDVLVLIHYSVLVVRNGYAGNARSVYMSAVV